MNRRFRILLLFAALAVGGGLGRLLLREPDTLGITAFFLITFALGYVFYEIDKKLFE